MAYLGLGYLIDQIFDILLLIVKLFVFPPGLFSTLFWVAI